MISFTAQEFGKNDSTFAVWLRLICHTADLFLFNIFTAQDDWVNITVGIGTLSYHLLSIIMFLKSFKFCVVLT